MQTMPLHLCSISCSLLTRTRTLERKKTDGFIGEFNRLLSMHFIAVKMAALVLLSMKHVSFT